MPDTVADTATDQQLPPGVHPNDPSVPWDGGVLLEDKTVPDDTAGSRYTTKPAPFGVDNGEALGVWERDRVRP